MAAPVVKICEPPDTHDFLIVPAVAHFARKFIQIKSSLWYLELSIATNYTWSQPYSISHD